MKISSSNSPILSSSSLNSTEFLQFYLEPNTTTLLPLQQLTEVLTIPIGEIVPIPHMSPWVMGVYNWRGDILWIVDLGHLVGLAPWYQQTNNVSVHKAIVLKASGNKATSTNIKTQMLGLVVNRVEDIELCNPDLIQSPPSSSVTPELVPFLRGYWLKPDGEMLVVLDGEAIMAAMPKPSNYEQ
ncbi:MAG: chemotaxis protein CheW [Symploca sp. SIO2C1]|nr:chemotaxis protein CheW [Symploca sp. SIO2C1]